MNKNNYGVPSLILGGFSFFFTLMQALESSGPGIFIALMSIGAIIFGLLALIKRQIGISAGTGFLGLILGLICLYFSVINVFSLQKLFFSSGYQDVTFVKNSNIVGLRYCKSYDDCFIKYTFDVSTQQFSKQQENNDLDKYSYSRDGKKVLFLAGSEHAKNILMMNADASEEMPITYSSDADTSIVVNNFDLKSMKVKTNSCPSFDPDGKRVIFVRCTFMVKKKGKSESSQCDIYENDLNTGKERRLTNYNFGNFGYISCPHYFSDGKRFIFSNYVIFIMDENNIERKAAISNLSMYTTPSISFDDKITYIGDTNDYSENEIFIKVGDEIKQLTNMKATIKSADISSDGKLIVFNEDRDRRGSYHFWIMNSDGTDLKELIPPKD